MILILKVKVLKILELNRGKNISGNEIAKMLNVTRSAVWKAVKALRNEGYNIPATENKGYCLSYDNDILSEEGITPYLKSKFIGKTIKVYKKLPSTNSEARLLANQGAEHGTVVLSDEQTEGRGRKGRSFYSPPGSGIYLSVILRPKASVQEAMLITSAAAVAVSKAIESVADVCAKIKWVNDIYIGDKKVCGILTEGVTNLENGEIKTIILGIGVNVTTSRFPAEIADIAAPISKSKTISRNQLTANILNYLEDIYENLAARSFLQEYKERCFILGKEIKVIKNGESYPAKAVDINEDAHLIVERGGSLEELTSGEISVRTI